MSINPPNYLEIAKEILNALKQAYVYDEDIKLLAEKLEEIFELGKKFKTAYEAENVFVSD